MFFLQFQYIYVSAGVFIDHHEDICILFRLDLMENTLIF